MKKIFLIIMDIIIFIIYFMIIKSGVLIIYSAQLFKISIYNKELYNTLNTDNIQLISLVGSTVGVIMTIFIMRYRMTDWGIKKLFRIVKNNKKSLE